MRRAAPVLAARFLLRVCAFTSLEDEELPQLSSGH